MAKSLRRLLLVTVIASALAVSIPGTSIPTAQAASSGCWGWEDHWEGRRNLYASHLSLEWCSRDGRISHFHVRECWTEVRAPWAVKDPRQDCRPKNPLGWKTLDVSANFEVYSTISMNIKGVHFGPGPLTTRYEIRLHPNGRITGTRYWLR